MRRIKLTGLKTTFPGKHSQVSTLAMKDLKVHEAVE